MARTKIVIPQQFRFKTSIPVRISDINYGGHVGNDSILSLIHECRIRFLASLGYTEMNMEGAGLIMSDVGIEFKNELFYGDILIAHITTGDIQRSSFDLYYKLEKHSPEKTITVALAKTGMVCYDYTLKKVTGIPEAAKIRLAG